MPVPHYGVWACRPTRYVAEGEGVKTPHIELFFTDDASKKERRAAINVKSNDKDSRLVFWVSRNFSHPIINQLSKLDLEFHLVQDSDSGGNQNHHHYRYRSYHTKTPDLQGIDFYRMEDLVDSRTGKLLWHDIPGLDNDILDKMRPILDNAIKNSATAYIYGASFGSGIHNVHMNQGSLPKFDNGVFSDGAIIFQFDDGHWEAVFLAFASQRLPTDEEGKPERGSKTLADMFEEQDT
ncbi:hypothetical protein N7475_009846 [Penicillium sp. IBT 31633x]|nr:hypothetical protein N7475_009846 [Penicillium sp. IBT 31633x]